MGVSNEIIRKFADFYNYLLLERQVKKATAQSYLAYHRTYINWLGEREYNYENISAYMAEKRQICTPTHLNHLRTYARVYCCYLKERNLPFDKKILKIKKLREIEPIKATMSDSEIESFLKLPPFSVIRKHGSSGVLIKVTYRKGYDIWTLFFSIMAYTGMRPNEVAQLTVDTVDFGRNVFVITPNNSKTNNLRYVPIPPNIIKDLEKYILGLKGKYLFMQGNKVFDNVDWHYNFHKRLERLGIKREGLSPYSLRHSYITRMIEEDVNIFKVQKLVGHTQIATTAKYTHLATKDMQKTVLRHPAVRKGMDKKLIAEYLMEYVKTLEVDVLKYNFSRNVLDLKLRIK